MRPRPEPGDREAVALERLRQVAGRLPGTEETVTFGHPTFKVGGRTFAVLDRYGGVGCLWLRVGPAERAGLLASRGWFESPYDPHGTALCCSLAAIDWRRVRALVRRSHALARRQVESPSQAASGAPVRRSPRFRRSAAAPRRQPAE